MIQSLTFLTIKRLARMAAKHDITTLQKQLTELACPNEIRIGLKLYPVPITVNDFRDNICWGQRLFMATEHQNDFETFLYFFANYYQPIVTGKPYSEERVLRFYDKITKCHAHEAYPVLTRLVELFTECVQIENGKLNSEPNKEMKAAEINRLQPFSDLNILELVSQKCRVKLEEAHLQEYNVVFALLWYEKEVNDFQIRYNEIQKAKVK